MPYGELIKEAFRIARGHRYLWPFGIFAGTSFSLNVNVPGDWSGGGSADVDPALAAAVVVAILVFVVGFAVLGVLAHGALPQAVAAIRRGERPGFRAALRTGRSTFWRVLGLGALVLAITLGLIIAVVIPVGAMVGVTFAVTEAAVVRVPAVVGAVLVGIAAAMLVLLPLFATGQHALRAAVLGGHSVVSSLRFGWRLLRANLGHSLLLLLIQQGIAMGAGLALAIGLALLAAPAIILALAGGGAATTVVLILSAVVLVPLALAAYGAIGAFTHTFWTLAYLRLTWPEPPPPPPSERPY